MKKLIPVIFSFFISATVIWQANTESDLAGYRCYRSTTSGSYIFGDDSPDKIFDVGAGLTSTTVDIPDDAGYYVMTAYDLSGNESGPSNEVFFDASPRPVGQVTIQIIITTGN